MILRIVIIIVSFNFAFAVCQAQKVLQIERYGKAETLKIYIGEEIFIKTKQYKDVWYRAPIQDILVDAKAIVFHDRIVSLEDIVFLKFRKRSKLLDIGKSLQFGAIVPAVYEVIYGLVEPPIDAEGILYISGGTFLLGTLVKLIPPKKYKFGNRKWLRVVDLNFN